MIMPNYDPSDIYVIHPNFRLRNEKKYAIAVHFDQDRGSSGILRLKPVEAAVTAMFDGARTCAGAADICTAFFPDSEADPTQRAHSLIREVLTHHSEPRGQTTTPLLVRKADLAPDEVCRLRQYRPTDFIINPKVCRMNEMKLSFPVTILWLLTNECQVDCQYCYMPRSTEVQSDLLPWERAKELLYEAHRAGVMEIRLSGGDPMCYPHLFKFLEVMEELDFPSVVIPTKAYISAEKAARLAQFRVLRGIQFSIDSTVPQIADFIIQHPGFCARTLESIRNVQAAGMQVSSKSVITPYTLPTIPKLYRDLRGMGVDPVILATYCRSGYWHKDKLYNHPDDYQWLDKEIEKLKEEFPEDEIYYQNGPPQREPSTPQERGKHWSSRSRCGAGRDGFAICANGKVVACEQMPENDDNFIGDLRRQSIQEVWEGEALDKYMLHPSRDRFVGTVCHDCDEFEHCQTVIGPCVRESCIHFGTRWAPVPGCPKAPATRTV